MSEEMKLKSCPFCGGEGIPMGSGVIGWTIVCKDCGARVKVALVDLPVTTPDGVDESTRYTKEEAMRIARERWNRRSESEVKHGEWQEIDNLVIEHGLPTVKGKTWRCSICGEARKNHTALDMNCCPNCGAKMDGKEGAEE